MATVQANRLHGDPHPPEGDLKSSSLLNNANNGGCCSAAGGDEILQRALSGRILLYGTDVHSDDFGLAGSGPLGRPG